MRQDMTQGTMPVDTDRPEDKYEQAFTGEGAGTVFDAVQNGTCTFGQFMVWVQTERSMAHTRGYEMGYQDAKFYES